MWEQRVVLGQIADPASLGTQVPAVRGVEPDLLAERDPTTGGALQPGDSPQQRGLARAGRTDERNRLAGEAQLGAKIERSPREGDVDGEEIHTRTSSLAVRRIAALTMISSTPIAIA